MKIDQALPELLDIIQKLKSTYKIRSFTLDGRLVGDIGEILAAEHFDITLHTKQESRHDAYTSNGRLVQIKATLKDKLTFSPFENLEDVTEYYLGLQIREDASFDVVYNGPSRIIAEALKAKKQVNYRLHSLPVKHLKDLNDTAPTHERIPVRALARSDAR